MPDSTVCQLSIPVCSEAAGVGFFGAFIPAIASFTAAGYRHCESGDLTSVGGSGNYWSSSSYAAGNINAGYLGFNSGLVYPLGNASRAGGLSVRCVQE